MSLKKHEACFPGFYELHVLIIKIGKELIDWLIEAKICSSRADGAKIAQLLMDSDQILDFLNEETTFNDGISVVLAEFLQIERYTD